MQEIGQDDWERAFALYGLDAATGRLFRGLLHNISGSAQAFSMQTELLQMLFAQADGLLAQVENAASLDEARAAGAKLRAMLERRSSLVVHLENEVRVIREAMARCSGLAAAGSDAPGGAPFALREVIATELEFLNGDGFFKHKVVKEVSLAPDLPALHGNLVEIHQIVAALLENAAQSLQVAFAAGLATPLLSVAAALTGTQIQLAITDNGEGIEAESQTRIFTPFYSTRPGHLGVGLWLARRLAGRFGGGLEGASLPGRTTFTLTIPLEGENDAGCP